MRFRRIIFMSAIATSVAFSALAQGLPKASQPEYVGFSSERLKRIWGTAFWVDPKEKLIAVLMMQAASLQARYYRSLIRNLTSQALID
jgi:hypothetical protein